MTDQRRALPSVRALLESDSVRPLLARAPRGLVTEAVRAVIDRARDDPATAPADAGAWGAAVEAALVMREEPSLRPLFNATGVVLHTNLGRAPLAESALTAIRATAAGYCNLEYDIAQGERGSRYVHCVSLLRELTGAEDAIVVNNCAAALVLALNTVAVGRDALVSRGELLEIGGSFRVPAIMAKSGARLVEVGTTNRTYAADYEAACGDRTAAIVKVHRSNFVVDGFVADAGVKELAPIARAHGLPLLYDFGSGLLMSLETYGLPGEPTARDAIRAGASLVLMSGDKLMGGPQAGIMAGDGALVARLRANPLARALRVDKLTLAALEATLSLYRDPDTAVSTIPTLAMLTASEAAVRERAEALAARLRAHNVAARVVSSGATVGGGAFPAARIPSAAVALGEDAVGTEARLRGGHPPVVGRIADDVLLLDLRSVPAAHDGPFGDAVLAALS
jgi:L-seryl-tRNA(Ser) seleniumtransferase